jgi:hemerythrin-like domain-containing protein
MTAAEVLKHEHKIILLVMEGLARQVRAIRETGGMDAARLYQIVDFCQGFIDRCHHGKEEAYLFPALQARGLEGDRGLIAVLLQEHEEGRRRLGDIAETLPRAAGGEAGAAPRLADHLEAYRELLRAHTDKEDNVLFPMADQMLSAEEQRGLLEAFEQFEERVMGPEVHEQYHRLAQEVAAGEKGGNPG